MAFQTSARQHMNLSNNQLGFEGIHRHLVRASSTKHAVFHSWYPGDCQVWLLLRMSIFSPDYLFALYPAFIDVVLLGFV